MGREYTLHAPLVLALRETHASGEPDAGGFEKLLSTLEHRRRLAADKVGARWMDVYRILTKFGRAFASALHFSRK